MPETAVPVQVQPKPRKGWTKLSDTDWQKIKVTFETDPSRPSYDHLARSYGIDGSTIAHRAKRESWARKDSLALAAIRAVESKSDQIVQETAEKVGRELSQHLTETLQPWIEREKAKHVKNQVKRSKLALAQLDQHIAKDKLLSPKDSSFIAKTADTWDNVLRRNLGMNDAGPAAGSLTLNVLTNHAAVQVKSGSVPN